MNEPSFFESKQMMLADSATSTLSKAEEQARRQTPPNPGVIYKGVVLDNVDPGKLNRVLVSIEGVTAPLPPDGNLEQPHGLWAWTLNVFGGGQENGQKYGACFPFPIGSKVLVAFLRSGQNPYVNPVVLGGWYQGERVPEQLFDRKKKDKPYPNAWGWVSPKGHSILAREEEDEEAIELISKGGRKIVISDKKDNELITLVGKKGGSITLKEGSEGNCITMETPKEGQQCSLTLDGTTGVITIQAATMINLIAPTLNQHITGNLAITAPNITVAAQGVLSLAGMESTHIGVGIESPSAGAVVIDAKVMTVDVATTITTNAGGILEHTELGTVMLSEMGIAIASETIATVQGGTNVNINSAGVITLAGVLVSTPTVP